MQFVKPLTQVTKKSVATAGGKGAALGAMLRRGLPIPPGFVIRTIAFDKFLAETKIADQIMATLKQTDKNNARRLVATSQSIQRLIRQQKIPRAIGEEILSQYRQQKLAVVAVRSSAPTEDSATASWAGELDSYLGVTEKNLLLHVQKCWTSLFTPRALFYRLEKKVVALSMAVVVQQMIDSEISGVTFTIHPVTKNKNQLVTEAGYGLGETVAGGLITPDTYVVDKKTGRLLEKHTGPQNIKITRDYKGLVKTVAVPAAKRRRPKLTTKKIAALTKICLSIEKYWRSPCDIEWAYRKGNFYIIQSRPITTL